ncbi:MAG TPA: hypothetical protein VI298_16125 [Geobacteraceae bacterium]
MKPAKTDGQPESPAESPYISPKELAKRWRCARSSVDRIADRARLKKMFLGEGKNGIVRYLRKEVEEYERSRTVMATQY